MIFSLARLIIKYGIPLALGHYGGAALLEHTQEELMLSTQELKTQDSSCLKKTSSFLKQDASGLDNTGQDGCSVHVSDHQHKQADWEKTKNKVGEIKRRVDVVTDTVREAYNYTPCAHEKNRGVFGRKFKGFLLSYLPKEAVRLWFDECKLRRREAQLELLNSLQGKLEKLKIVYDRSETRAQRTK